MANKFDEHDWHSTGYVDEWVIRSRKNDDRRTSRFELMAEMIPYPKDTHLHVLDVGTGYGPVAAFILQTFPNSSVVAQDYSAPMLRHAEQSLAHHGDRIRFHQADLLSQEWHHECAGPFHAVVSSIAIHNLQSPARIRQLYGEIYDQIIDGGCFLNMDLVSAPTPALQHIYWTKMMRQQPLDRPDATDASPNTHHPLSETDLEEGWPPFPGTMEQQLEWLRRAGFATVDCFWKEMGIALTGGFK